MNSSSTIAQPASGSILPGVIAGLIMGALQITFTLAYSALLFSNELNAFLPSGIAMVLIGTIISILILSLLSSYAGSIGSAQDIPAILLVVMVTAVTTAQMPTGITPATFSTIVAIMSVCAMLTALLMLVSGFFGLGSIIRYIPFPVIGGLLAGTGWMLVVLGMNMMTDIPLEFAALPMLLENDLLIRWLPGVVIALVLTLVQRLSQSPLALPVTIIGSFAACHIMLTALNVPLPQARTMGLLLDISEPTIEIVFSVSRLFEDVNWALVLEQLPLMISLCFLCTIICLVQASSIEVVVDQEMDMQKELYANGVANGLIGIFGGIVSFHHISDTSMAFRLGAKTRLVGIVTAIVCALPFLFGSGWLGYFPIPVLAGIVLYLGFDFLYEWLFRAYRRLPRWEYLIVIAIFFAILFFSFPIAILFGIFCGSILFLVTYSRSGVVQEVQSGPQFRSMVMRGETEEAFLLQHSRSIGVLQPRGLLFFGTSSSLYERVRAYVLAHQSELQIMLIDFNNVRGIDYTAVMGLTRIRRILNQHGIKLITNAVPVIDSVMIKNALTDSTSPGSTKFTDDIDQALEIAEEILLASGDDYSLSSHSLSEKLALEDWSDMEIDELKHYLEMKIFSGGEKLISSNADTRDVILIEAGQLEVSQMRNDKRVRLRVYTSGMVVGEITTYTGESRTADVIAKGPAIVFILSNASLTLMETNNPKIAIKLHRYLAKNLAIKISDDVRLGHIRNSIA